MSNKNQLPSSSPFTPDAGTVTDLPAPNTGQGVSEHVSPTAITVEAPALQTALPVWPPTQQQYRRRDTLSPTLQLLLFGAAFLLIVSGLGAIIFTSARQYRSTLHAVATFDVRSTQNVIATVQAQTQGTAQAIDTAQTQINVTATSGANNDLTATATIDNATATATALGDFYTQATTGTPAFTDGLSDNTGSGKWDEGSTSPSTGCAFTNGNYHASEAQQGYFQPCIARSTTFSNFAYQVNVTTTKGNRGQAGLLFRADSENKAYYFFRVSIDGSYGLDVYNTDGKGSTLVSGRSSAIATGFGQSNTLTVVAKDTHYFLYVGGQYVDTATDSTLTEGKIGVAAVDVSTPVDVTYSNAQVWKL